MTPDNVITALDKYRFRGVVEHDIQDAIEQVFTINAVVYEREAWLSKRDRIDFLVNGHVGVEIKTEGTRVGILRQLARYAKSPRIDHLVLASTRHRLLAEFPPNIGGVPLTAYALRGPHL